MCPFHVDRASHIHINSIIVIINKHCDAMWFDFRMIKLLIINVRLANVCIGCFAYQLYNLFLFSILVSNVCLNKPRHCIKHLMLYLKISVIICCCFALIKISHDNSPAHPCKTDLFNYCLLMTTFANCNPFHALPCFCKNDWLILTFQQVDSRSCLRWSM